MQFRITKTIALAGFILAAASAQAQIKIYKITNGTRTAVANGSKVDIQLNEDETVKNNVVIDLDIAAFKKAYRFDRVAISFVTGGTYIASFTHVFDSQLNTKKYAGKGTIPVYVYNTNNFKETDFRTLVLGLSKYNGTPEGTKIVISGCYITGEEGYFDVNDNYKFRDTYSKEEQLAEIELNVIYDASKILNYEYSEAMRAVDGIDRGFKSSVIDEVEQYVAPYVATPLYGALSKGFREVYDAKIAVVRAETDKKKAIDAVKVFVDETNIMHEVARKDKDVLKAMNKEIKTKTTVEEKWALIKSKA